jgi:arylsulfatase A-like enzyme
MRRLTALVWLLVLSIYGAACVDRVTVASNKPNVIVFFVDDLGWTDIACFGSDFYETPQVDRLAARGVRFTNAYSACTVCSPSRAALMTGMYPARLHVTDFIPGHVIENTPLLKPEWTQQLNLEHVTIAEVLQQAGYATAHFGKWHLTPRSPSSNPNDDGDFPEFYPDKQGFDFNFGGCERGAPASYYWPYGRGKTLEERQQNNTYRTLPRESGGEGVYLTDQLAREAARFIQSVGDQPFFLSFPFYNVHTPLEGREDLVAKYTAKLKGHPEVRHRNVQYAAMVESVDQAIGLVMEQVEQQGLTSSTLVIFSSDNGGLCPQSTSNLPLRQGKGTIYEGGVRVPTIVSWPERAALGAECQEPIMTLDFFPTIVEAAGVDASATRILVDGRSLVPLLTNPQGSLGREALYWHYPHYHMMGAVPYSAIRMGEWKLIERLDGSPLELYRLSDDIHEDRNLAKQQPELAADLHGRLQQWRQQVGAQMPTVNPAYDSSLPIGRRQGTVVSPMATVRE